MKVHKTKYEVATGTKTVPSQRLLFVTAKSVSSRTVSDLLPSIDKLRQRFFATLRTTAKRKDEVTTHLSGAHKNKIRGCHGHKNGALATTEKTGLFVVKKCSSER